MFNLIKLFLQKSPHLKRTALKIYARADGAARLKVSTGFYGADDVANELGAILARELINLDLENKTQVADFMECLSNWDVDANSEETYQCAAIQQVLYNLVLNAQKTRSEHQQREALAILLRQLNTIKVTDLLRFNELKFRLEQAAYMSDDERDSVLDRIHESVHCPVSIKKSIEAMRNCIIHFGMDSSADHIVDRFSSLLQKEQVTDELRIKLNVLIGVLGKVSVDASNFTNLLAAATVKVNPACAHESKLEAGINRLKNRAALTENQKKTIQRILPLQYRIKRYHEESDAFREVLVQQMTALLVAHDIRLDNQSTLLGSLPPEALRKVITGHLKNTPESRYCSNNLNRFREQSREFRLLASQYTILDKAQKKLPVLSETRYATVRQLQTGVDDFQSELHEDRNRKILEASTDGCQFLKKIASILSCGLFYRDAWRKSDGCLFFRNISSKGAQRKAYSKTYAAVSGNISWR
ncbi:hypothetical protein AQUSIP_00420 [Aquicella siphonis]|uniref:Uncharacterized protein n=1 Tax=Aquicella siphonis TaxID=254247 RepID=A0A5E4PD29_9COXI|nr:hypothetical protein [Aquicella siphonis]VVC74770.1 hypothetical protein AQUSIP_00420 [Aquicella siphonis]